MVELHEIVDVLAKAIPGSTHDKLEQSAQDSIILAERLGLKSDLVAPVLNGLRASSKLITFDEGHYRNNSSNRVSHLKAWTDAMRTVFVAVAGQIPKGKVPNEDYIATNLQSINVSGGGKPLPLAKVAGRLADRITFDFKPQNVTEFSGSYHAEAPGVIKAQAFIDAFQAFKGDTEGAGLAIAGVAVSTGLSPKYCQDVAELLVDQTEGKIDDVSTGVQTLLQYVADVGDDSKNVPNIVWLRNQTRVINGWTEEGNDAYKSPSDLVATLTSAIEFGFRQKSSDANEVEYLEQSLCRIDTIKLANIFSDNGFKESASDYMEAAIMIGDAALRNRLEEDYVNDITDIFADFRLEYDAEGKGLDSAAPVIGESVANFLDVLGQFYDNHSTLPSSSELKDRAKQLFDLNQDKAKDDEIYLASTFLASALSDLVSREFAVDKRVPDAVEVVYADASETVSLTLAFTAVYREIFPKIEPKEAFEFGKQTADDFAGSLISVDYVLGFIKEAKDEDFTSPGALPDSVGHFIEGLNQFPDKKISIPHPRDLIATWNVVEKTLDGENHVSDTIPPTIELLIADAERVKVEGEIEYAPVSEEESPMLQLLKSYGGRGVTFEDTKGRIDEVMGWTTALGVPTSYVATVATSILSGSDGDINDVHKNGVIDALEKLNLMKSTLGKVPSAEDFISVRAQVAPYCDKSSDITTAARMVIEELVTTPDSELKTVGFEAGAPVDLDTFVGWYKETLGNSSPATIKGAHRMARQAARMPINAKYLITLCSAVHDRAENHIGAIDAFDGIATTLDDYYRQTGTIPHLEAMTRSVAASKSASVMIEHLASSLQSAIKGGRFPAVNVNKGSDERGAPTMLHGIGEVVVGTGAAVALYEGVTKIVTTCGAVMPDIVTANATPYTASALGAGLAMLTRGRLIPAVAALYAFAPDLAQWHNVGAMDSAQVGIKALCIAAPIAIYKIGKQLFNK